MSGLTNAERQQEVEADQDETEGGSPYHASPYEQRGVAAVDSDRCRSWKDEYILLLWSIPMVAAFVPFLRPYILAGFEVLSQNVPPWYVNVWGIIAAGVFGVNRIVNLAELHIRSRVPVVVNNSDEDDTRSKS